MENKNLDEVQQFRNSLEAQSGNPDPKFVNSLKTKTLSKYLGSNWLTAHLLRNVVVGAFAFSMIGIVAFIAIQGNLNTAKTPLTSQSKEVLSKVFSNNPQALLALKNQAPASDFQAARVSSPEIASDSGSTSAPAPVDLAPQNLRGKDFNYSFSKSEITSGPALGKCQAYALGQEGIVESYAYFGDSNSQTKTITYDKDKNLTDYYLYTNKFGIIYKGGKYAVKTLYPVVSMPVRTNTSAPETLPTIDFDSAPQLTDPGSSVGSPVSNSSSISSSISQTDKDSLALNFFGDNAQVSDKKTENGKEYYEIIWETNVNCDISAIIAPIAVDSSTNETTKNTPSANTVKIVNRVRVDATTYNVYQEERFLGSIGAANLMQTSNNQSQTQKVDLSAVQQNFNFEFSVPVKEVTIKYTGYEASDVTKYLSSHDIAIISPAASDSKLTSLSLPAQAEAAVAANFSYVSDRDFYPTGARGDTLFKTVSDYQQKVQQAQRILPIVTSSYSSASDYVTVNIYEKNADALANIQEFITAGAKSLPNQTIKVGDEDAEWQVYELTFDGASVPPTGPVTRDGGGTSGNSGSGAADSTTVDPAFPGKINLTTTFLVGTYYKNVYLIQLSSDVSKLSLKSLVTSKPADMQALTKQITDSINNIPEKSILPMPANDAPVSDEKPE